MRLGPVLLVAGLAVVIIALLQLSQRSEATTTSFAIQGLEQEKLELETTVRQLEAEVAALSSLSRIGREATRLGLEPAKARESIQVNVVWSAVDDGLLPTRFAPAGEVEAKEEGRSEQSAWWRQLLKLLPFN